MKRSQNLRLSLMALAIPAALTGCESGPDTGTVLLTASDCETQPIQVSVAECRRAYDSARAQHTKVAPRFEGAFDCREEFGQCTSLQENGQTYFIPAMGGFLLGYGASRLADRDDDNGGGGGYAYFYGGSSPLYRSRSGGYYNPSGGHVSDGLGRVKGASGNTVMPSRAVTVSRSGFGSSSAARSSFGGGRGS